MTDLVTQIALKWGRRTHDVALIALLLSHSTAKWASHLADKQAALIEERMQREGRTLSARLKGLFGQNKPSEPHLPAMYNTSQLKTPVVTSSLWTPPDLSRKNKSDNSDNKQDNSS